MLSKWWWSRLRSRSQFLFMWSFFMTFVMQWCLLVCIWLVNFPASLQLFQKCQRLLLSPCVFNLVESQHSSFCRTLPALLSLYLTGYAWWTSAVNARGQPWRTTRTAQREHRDTVITAGWEINCDLQRSLCSAHQLAIVKREQIPIL